jgi:hypothetical protein
MTTTSSYRPRRLSISSSLHLPHLSALALLSPVFPPPAARLALAAPLPSSRPASPLPPALTPPDCPSTHSVEVDAVLRAVSLVRPSTTCSPCLSCCPPCSLAGPPTIPRADQLSACLDPNASPASRGVPQGYLSDVGSPGYLQSEVPTRPGPPPNPALPRRAIAPPTTNVYMQSQRTSSLLSRLTR